MRVVVLMMLFFLSFGLFERRRVWVESVMVSHVDLLNEIMDIYPCRTSLHIAVPSPHGYSSSMR